MTTLERTTAIGVFTERSAADAALDELREADFPADQLGFVVRDREATEHTIMPTDITELKSMPATATGAMSGGLIGGIVGAAASLLIPGIGPALAGGILFATLGGAAMGAFAGGFTGSLIHMGIPEEEAHRYQDLLTSGHTIVTVYAPGRFEEALRILARHGAYNSAVAEVADMNTASATQSISSTSPATDSEQLALSGVDSTAEEQPVRP